VRYHIHAKTLQRAVKGRYARRDRQPGVPHTFRRAFATQLLETGDDIHTVRGLLGHNDVENTMIYTHVNAALPGRS
jgi:site-specific recombinase XerD